MVIIATTLTIPMILNLLVSNNSIHQLFKHMEVMAIYRNIDFWEIRRDSREQY